MHPRLKDWIEKPTTPGGPSRQRGRPLSRFAVEGVGWFGSLTDAIHCLDVIEKHERRIRAEMALVHANAERQETEALVRSATLRMTPTRRACFVSDEEMLRALAGEPIRVPVAADVLRGTVGNGNVRRGDVVAGPSSVRFVAV